MNLLKLITSPAGNIYTIHQTFSYIHFPLFPQLPRFHQHETRAWCSPYLIFPEWEAEANQKFRLLEMFYISANHGSSMLLLHQSSKEILVTSFYVFRYPAAISANHMLAILETVFKNLLFSITSSFAGRRRYFIRFQTVSHPW